MLLILFCSKIIIVKNFDEKLKNYIDSVFFYYYYEYIFEKERILEK